MKTRFDLFNINIPEQTETYTPVSNKDLIETVMEKADKLNLNLVREKWNTTKTSDIMSGILAFKGSDDDLDMQIGIVNSYNKMKPVTIGIGSQVIICENGMVLADYKFKRKHTGEVWSDLNSHIDYALYKLYDEYEKSLKIRHRFSDMSLNITAASEILGRLYVEEEILTPHMLTVVKNELHNPTYQVFSDPTVWSFYNHVTHALKRSHPSDYIDRHVEFHQFMEETFY